MPKWPPVIPGGVERPRPRQAALVLKQLQSEGYRVSKASVCRWALKWQQVAHAAADLVVVEHKAPTPAVPATIRSAEPGIPAELRGVLPERLLHVARAGGVDAVEGAARALSEEKELIWVASET